MDVFTITGFHQAGREVSGVNPNNVRIVCDTAQGITIAFWGTVNTNTHNIDLIENVAKTKGFPFGIECDTNISPPPQAFQTQYGHSKWVGENNSIKIL